MNPNSLSTSEPSVLWMIRPALSSSRISAPKYVSGCCSLDAWTWKVRAPSNIPKTWFASSDLPTPVRAARSTCSRVSRAQKIFLMTSVRLMARRSTNAIASRTCVTARSRSSGRGTGRVLPPGRGRRLQPFALLVLEEDAADVLGPRGRLERPPRRGVVQHARDLRQHADVRGRVVLRRDAEEEQAAGQSVDRVPGDRRRRDA